MSEPNSNRAPGFLPFTVVRIKPDVLARMNKYGPFDLSADHMETRVMWFDPWQVSIVSEQGGAGAYPVARCTVLCGATECPVAESLEEIFTALHAARGWPAYTPASPEPADNGEPAAPELAPATHERLRRMAKRGVPN